ncbi:Glutathione synthase/Ribosomal protein S6 modification enzyme (glutaminyl transferase) [gamma proteobacterium HdN1]|nr:Glutathione synthase/Ribosomal protein S6 modification enzyme (glutaminyl transferase) [gamma proteobacterium HdN1]
MASLYIVVDDLKDWGPYFPSDNVITFEDYLTQGHGSRHARTQVINLCRSYRYLSKGYYCSLLAEARGQRVLPSVRTLNDLGRRSLYVLQLEGLDDLADKSLSRAHKDDEEVIIIKSYFGETDKKEFEDFAKSVFERLPCPILEIELKKRKTWQIVDLKPVSPKALTDEEQTQFADALDIFSRKVWKAPKARRKFRYDLAILVNPKEKLPPSDNGALKKFVKAGRGLGVDVELIDKRDFIRLAEYDGLFIRETTSIDHHTYKFAKKAESEGMVVIDDPTSILRCTNKVYLADLLTTNRVPVPKTHILIKHDKERMHRAIEDLGFPLVLKIPDGSFSRGVVKVRDENELIEQSKVLFQKSSLLLAQEFMYTEFDWRIGVLNNKPLYACRYYMVKNHWQIYQHGVSRVDAGGYDTLPTYEVPKPVLDAALKATKLIGNSLYGVDLKQAGERAVVIEVNDNPNVDSGVEDKFLGDTIYEQIMQEFVRRMEDKRSSS